MHVYNHSINSLLVFRQSRVVRRAVLTYTLKQELSLEEISSIKKKGLAGFWTDIIKSPLLLL